jgi:uncharacterized OB-fold protein
MSDTTTPDTASSQLPTGEPNITHDNRRYWEATAEGRIELPRCTACDLVIWYPRSICPDCQSMDLSWETMSGNGTVYSYTITRAGVGRKWREHLPLVVAYVQLDEGPIVLTNIVDTDPSIIEIGMSVTAVFHDTGHPISDEDGAPNSAILRFTAVP